MCWSDRWDACITNLAMTVAMGNMTVLSTVRSVAFTTLLLPVPFDLDDNGKK